MGYQRDLRLDRLASKRLKGCEACKELSLDGLSYLRHNCGQTLVKSPFSGADLERLGF